MGAKAMVRLADGSSIVRAQLTRLLVLLTRRYPVRSRAACHQLLLLRSFGTIAATTPELIRAGVA